MKGNSFECVCKTGWEGPQCEKGKGKKDKKSPSIMQLLNVNICVKIASDSAWIMWVNRLLITRMFP